MRDLNSACRRQTGQRITQEASQWQRQIRAIRLPPRSTFERARLRAKGWSEDKIEKILFEREVAGSQPSQAAGAGPGQGNMTGVLGNASAVLSHAKGAIPAIQSNIAKVADPAAPPAARTQSAVVLAFVAVIVAVVGYAIYQEWQQHIVNATITSTNEAEKSKAGTRW